MTDNFTELSTDTPTIGFIGIGNMGFALLEGALQSEVVNKSNVYVYDISADNLQKATTLGVNVCKTESALLELSDFIVISIKPYQISDLITANREHFANKAVISVAAGVGYAEFAELLPKSARILTILPNTPLSVGTGVIGATRSETSFAKPEYAFFERIFSATAKIYEVPEKLLGVLSAISGSGPAFTAIFIDALADAGVKGGLSRNDSYAIATQTVLGTAKLIAETGKLPSQIKDEVCSPGGTSIEGVKSLEETGFRGSVHSAIDATINKWYN